MKADRVTGAERDRNTLPEAAAKGGYQAGVWREMGLSDGEYGKIVDILGRAPNWTELGMYAVLWSEHCAYKHSRPLFSLLPTQGECILQGVGENAGVVDIGDGLAVTFKVESHNHPSAIEPYQGAATGVGGILRDIFTMGARPIAVLDSLRFGPIEDERVRYLFNGVVAGIAGYGNAVGVPTVGGEVGFDPSYKGNPLVNVMAVGLVSHEHVATASATGVGNPVMVVGARTGRDGIHGASFASSELTEASAARRPSVQVGDPFTEKLLIEACIELIQSGVVIGIQDMGAAGLTSSSSEMAARARAGIDMDLLKVPRREPDMTPYEVMLSESQERMLVVPKRGAEERVRAIFAKWGLEAVVVGSVTDDGMLRVREGDQVVAEVPAKSLSTDGAPAYHPKEEPPAYLNALGDVPLPEEPIGALGPALLSLLQDPNIADKGWVFRQYDHTVQTRTAVPPGAADAAVLRLRESKKGLAATIDCNALHCYIDPKRGAQAAVAEAARNLVCTGARPLALTDGLNFGNPEKPEVFWQFHRAIEGIAEAAEALGTPVTGGNVSLYNETHGTAIHPTPVIGMIGILSDVNRRMTQGFKGAGDVVFLLGRHSGELGGSRYLQRLHDLVAGPLPALDLDLERRVQRFCLEAAGCGLLRSAHDCSEGGLAVALAESCLSGGYGVRARIHVPARGTDGWMRTDALLFGEGYSRIVVSVALRDAPALEESALAAAVPYERLGEVVKDEFYLDVVTPRIGVPGTAAGADGEAERLVFIHEPLAALADAWFGSIPRMMDGEKSVLEYVAGEYGEAH